MNNTRMIELEKELDRAKAHVRKVEDDIDSIKEKELLPEFKRKYIGKCCIYRNSYGGSEDSWNLYMKIIGIKNLWIIGGTIHLDLEVFGFEECRSQYHSEDEDVRELRIFRYGRFSADLMEREITKKQFDMAWDKEIEKIKRMKV